MSKRAKLTAKTPEAKRENSVSQTKKTNFSPPINSSIDQILFLQRTVGNQAVGKLLKSGFIQAKLTIGLPGDIYEQEADRVAEQVMRMPDLSKAQRNGVSEYYESPSIQRMCTECEGELQRQPMEEEEELLQTKEVFVSTPEVTPSAESQINSIRGRGQPLPESVRAFFEPRFRQDFSQVRIHTDSNAGESAKAVNALAYTVGRDVVFGAGQYSPETESGKKLLAHELTHVVQQTVPAAGVVQRSPDDDEKEKAEEKPAAKFVGCNKDQQSKIEEAIKQAERLASRAVQAFERDIALSYEMSAMKAHFGSLGSDQKSTIIERYKHIQANSGSKTYTCAKKGKKVKEGKEIVDRCGEAPCPGSEITLFPNFGKEGCPAGPLILHEAAHNAGACDDIDKGNSYPPASAENNAYSYEYFALDVAAGYKEPPELKKHKPKVP